MFAHLAVIWKACLPNNKLYHYLQGYDNLCSFCGRILQRYFPPEEEGKPLLVEFPVFTDQAIKLMSESALKSSLTTLETTNETLVSQTCVHC